MNKRPRNPRNSRIKARSKRTAKGYYNNMLYVKIKNSVPKLPGTEFSFDELISAKAFRYSGNTSAGRLVLPVALG